MFQLRKNLHKDLINIFALILFLMTSPALFTQDLFDQWPTTVNEVDVQITNYGILGQDVRSSSAGGFWPRSAQNPGTYIFGSGFWLGCIVEGENGPERRVNISYNPISGLSWFVPGDVSDGPEIVTTPEASAKYGLYFSTNYNENGQDFDNDSPAWPLWNPSGAQVGSAVGNLGQYVSDVADRNVATQGSGPVFISDQDVICRYKDTDSTLYEGGRSNAKPFGLQVEQATYSWSDASRENFILLRYDVTNSREQTLNECFFAFVCDYDVGTPTPQRVHSQDDRMQVFDDAAARPMVAIWSEGGVEDAGYGYMGLALMQSPEVDENNFIRDDSDPTDLKAQIGLTTVRHAVLQNAPTSHVERYDFISAGVRDADLSAGDGSTFLGSGPFNLRPGETARFVIGYFFAPSVGEKPDGSEADIARLVDEVNKGAETWTSKVVSVNSLASASPFSVQLSPNPVNSQLNITADQLPGVNKADVEIIDQTGRVLITQSVAAGATEDLSLNLDVSALAAGTYFCRIRMGEFVQSRTFAVVR